MAKHHAKKAKRSRSRRLSLAIGCALLTLLAGWGTAGEWFVHHPRAWLIERRIAWPRVLVKPLEWFGNPLADITDGLGWTGHDAVYEYDTEAPSGQIAFAGLPVRTGSPAPDDIRVIDRGEFKIGWSDRLRHPVWCAYHVKRDALYDAGRRPGFTCDRSLARAPRPGDYSKSGYDRGHMVPNYAIATRYGTDAQKLTFMMSNISPQSAALNRGIWRDFEHRIADLWTARYGEIWVIVGALSPSHGKETLSGTDIDVPYAYYQIVLAQEGMDVRALAILVDQQVPWSAWAARNIVTIDEIERRSGLDFNPEMPSFLQDPLEADLPTRLWPVKPWDIFRQIALRFQ